MPSRQTTANLRRKHSTRHSGGWRARVKIDGVSYYLGTFTTMSAAHEAEQQFRTAAQGLDEWGLLNLYARSAP